ncbi:MAG TPA: hypothetical protein VGF94_24610 [Kofleriaceae bacterium]|jgi:hypothetical protein
MRLPVAVLVVAAFACGGKPKPPTTPLPPDPQPEADKPAEPPPTKPEPPKPPAELPALDASVPAPKPTVKLVSAGKGKRAPLKLTPKSGAKQQVELVFDISEHQGAPEELGGNMDTAYPSIVLQGDSEVTAVEPGGAATFTLAITGTEVHDDGGKTPAAQLDQLKQAIATVKGLQLASTLDASGVPGDLKLHVDKPQAATAQVLAQLLPLWPAWPLLPAEPVGVGAKWTVTQPSKVSLGMVAIDITYTTDYELTAHTGSTWTIKGKTKVSGADQAQKDAKVQKIGGGGDSTITLTDGALYPASTQHVSTSFEAVVSGQDQSGATKSGTIAIELKQGSQITPK